MSSLERTITDTVYRALAAHILAIERRANVGVTAKNAYPNLPEVVLASLDLPGWYSKATTSPAQTTVANWAAELAGKRTVGIVASISAPLSAYSQLAARGISLNFAGAGVVTVPRHAPGVVPGFFVGEGVALPVITMATSTTAATMTKGGFISFFTGEVGKYSTPSIELLLRQTMSIDAALSIDSKLLSADAAVASVSPAGILAGVAEVPHSTKGSATEKFAADLGNLAAAIASPVDLVYVASVSDYARALAYAPGIQGRLITSPALAAKTLIALDVADFFAAEDSETFDIAVSREATLVARDDPAPVTSAAGARGTPTSSAFQADLVAIRLVADVTFGMARSGRVSWTSGVAW